MFPNCPNVLWTCFGVIFLKNFFAQCSIEGRVFEMFPKNQKKIKIPKMPKIVPKKVQTCFQHVLVNFFRKLFCPVFHGGSSLRNVLKKNFKNTKMPKIVPKSVQTCFEHVLGYFLRKFLFAQCTMEGGVFEMLSKIKKVSKFQKRPKTFPKCPKVFWTCFGVLFSEISFCPVFHGGWSLRNAFKKSKKFQNSKNARKRSQSVQKCFEHVLGYFSRKFFLPSVPRRVESSKCF